MARLSIGTAQFGYNYGLFNNYESDKLNITNIFKKVALYNIEFIDTALSYGNAHQRLRALDLNNFKIITKIPAFEISNIDESLERVFNGLGQENIYGVLFHNENDLTSKNSNTYLMNLNEYKENKKVNKIGVSIYSFQILNRILDKYSDYIDIVQVPFNIFDNRLYENNLMKYMKKCNIEVHVRSIFLQGLALNSTYTNSYFLKWKTQLNNWFQWLKLNNLDPVDVCMSYVQNFDDIDVVIFGFNSEKQLDQILNHKKINIKDMPNFNIIDENFINPSKWKI